MGNLSLDIPLERPCAGRSAGQAVAEPGVCVASFGDAIADDYADFVRVQGGSPVQTIQISVASVAGRASPAAMKPAGSARPTTVATGESLVLFVKPTLSNEEERDVERFLDGAANEGMYRLCIVSTFRVHLGDA